MPNWLQWLLFVVLFAAVVYLFVQLKETRADASRVDTYLGTNRGPPSAWTGLSGNLMEHARDVRDALEKLSCRIHMLEKDLTTPPTQCPPGPPGTVPKDPGGYP